MLAHRFLRWTHKFFSLYRFMGILLSVLLLLLACQRPSDSPITTLTLSGWQSSPVERQILQHILKDFEAAYPQYRVKYEVITDQYMDIIKTRLIGDTAPDVFYLDALEAPLLMRHQVLEPLDNYITNEFDLPDFQPNLLKAFQSQEKLYGIPKDFSTLALIYNPQLFEAQGLTIPPQTWEQLREYSQRLTQDQDGDRRIDLYGFGITPELARLQFMIKADQGRSMDQQGYATFASPQSVKRLQLIIDQYRQDRTAALPSDLGTHSGIEMFAQAKAAMVIEGTWAIPYFRETFPDLTFATAEIPSIQGKQGTMAYTVAYVMNQRCQHKAAAWQLIAYLTGKEGMKAWTQLGLVLPSRQSILTELGYDQNPIYRPFVQGVDYATIWQSGEYLPTIMTHFNNQFLSALLGEQDLADALQKAQQDANQEIKAMDY